MPPAGGRHGFGSLSGVYLFSTTKGVSLISLSALIFLGGGMFVSVAVFGIGFYMLLRLVALTSVAMHRRNWINVYGLRASAVTHALGLIIFLAEIACTSSRRSLGFPTRL